MDVFTKYSPHQVGNSFGERLANATEEIFNLGYQNVIIIGNDCPTLSVQTLQKTDQLFDESKLVLGPAKDGGLYLIGINQAVFDKKIFVNFSWETNNLCLDWKYFISNQDINSFWLEEQQDIDDSISFYSFLNNKKGSVLLRKIFKSIIAGFYSSIIPINTLKLFFTYTNQAHLRAPPSSNF